MINHLENMTHFKNQLNIDIHHMVSCLYTMIKNIIIQLVKNTNSTKKKNSVPAVNNKAWVFLSHSTIDYDNVRRLRNLLEDNGFRPIMFYLRCLEQKHKDDELKSLLIREIDARNRFILCKSKNTNPPHGWVEFEVNYIKSRNRYYQIIDIEASDKELKKQIFMFKKNSIAYISYCRKDETFYEIFKKVLCHNLELEVPDVREIVAGCSVAEQIKNNIYDATTNGVFIPIITNNSLHPEWCMYEIQMASEYNSRRIIPFVKTDLNHDDNNYDRLMCWLGKMNYIWFDENCLKEAIEKLSTEIQKLSIINE